MATKKQPKPKRARTVRVKAVRDRAAAVPVERRRDAWAKGEVSPVRWM